MKIEDCQSGCLYKIQGLKWLWVVYKSRPDQFLVIRGGGASSHIYGSVYSSFFVDLEALDFDSNELTTPEKDMLQSMGFLIAKTVAITPKGCTCEITSLMSTGCTCGWIKVERTRK